jgi:hypothetical protein
MIVIAHSEPAVLLGTNEWFFVALSTVIILSILGPPAAADLEHRDGQ